MSENQLNINKPIQTTHSRLGYIDAAKGFAMLLVIFGHVVWFSVCNMHDADDFYVLNIIGRFHMPLFIFLSGLVVSTRLPNVRETLGDLYKRFRLLIVPFLFFGLIYAYTIGSGATGFITGNMKSGYWYLLVLFYCYLLHYLFQFVCKIKPGYAVELTFGIVTFIGLWSLNNSVPEHIAHIISLPQLMSVYPYFLAGVMVKRHNLHQLLFCNKWISLAAILSIIFLLLMRNTHIHGDYQLFSVSMILVVMTTLRACEETKSYANSFLRFIGRNTLDIYVLHYFFIHFLHLSFLRPYLQSNPVLEAAIITPPHIAHCPCFHRSWKDTPAE